MEHHGHRVVWVPAGADSLKKRLLVCARLEGTGHRGVDATMAPLEWHCVWDCGKTLPHFTVRDYVLVARVSKQVKHRKLTSTWTGPWRVANEDKEHVYALKHLVTAELRDVHVARMRVYADDKLEITGELLKVFRLGELGRVPHPGHLGYQAGCKRRRVRCQGGLGRTGGGREHLEAGVARVP